MISDRAGGGAAHVELNSGFWFSMFFGRLGGYRQSWHDLMRGRRYL